MTNHEDLKQFRERAKKNYSKVYNLVHNFETFLKKYEIPYSYIGSKTSRSVYVRVGIEMPDHEYPFLIVRFSDHRLPDHQKVKEPYVDFYCGTNRCEDNHSIEMIKQFVFNHKGGKWRSLQKKSF